MLHRKNRDPGREKASENTVDRKICRKRALIQTSHMQTRRRQKRRIKRLRQMTAQEKTIKQKNIPSCRRQ